MIMRNATTIQCDSFPPRPRSITSTVLRSNPPAFPKRLGIARKLLLPEPFVHLVMNFAQPFLERAPPFDRFRRCVILHICP